MQVSKTDPLVGEQIGGYQIERLIGRGLLNVSYLIRHPVHPGEMILHLFTVQEQLSFQARQRFLLRFAREAPALTALRHPHLLPVYLYGERLGYPYLVTPSVVEGSLADILKLQGPCTPAFIQEAMEQIAAGVEYLHSRGVMHGMLAPSNILLSDDSPRLQAGGFWNEAAVSSHGL